MKELEEEIEAAMIESQMGLGAESVLMKIQAKAAAEVAKKWMEKAIKDSFEQNRKGDLDPNECYPTKDYTQKWFKENGITK